MGRHCGPSLRQPESQCRRFRIVRCFLFYSVSLPAPMRRTFPLGYTRLSRQKPSARRFVEHSRRFFCLKWGPPPMTIHSRHPNDAVSCAVRPQTHSPGPPEATEDGLGLHPRPPCHTRPLRGRGSSWRPKTRPGSAPVAPARRDQPFRRTPGLCISGILTGRPPACKPSSSDPWGTAACPGSSSL